MRQSNKKGIINYFGNKKIGEIANTENLICIFRKKLENVRRQGYALDHEEWAVGVCCVAAPVFDFTNYPSHAISISGPSRNFTDEKVAQIVKDLTLLCKSLSEELSTRGT